MKPACWDSESNWAEWQRLNALAGSAPGKPLDHYCVDCTPEFKQRMDGAGRCAYPGVTFSQVTERRRDPATGKIYVVKTGSYRGRREQADEEAWVRRYEIRRHEDD